MKENKISKFSNYILYIAWFFFIIIIIRIVYIQNFWQEDWHNVVINRNFSQKKINAWKGDIFDKSGNLLISSVKHYNIYIDPCDTLKYKNCGLNQKVFKDSLAFLCKKLSNYFGDKTYKEYINIFINARKKGKRHHLLLKNLSRLELEKILTFPIFNQPNYNKSGIIISEKIKRVNVYNKLAKRTLGYFRGRELKTGLEGYYKNYINGEDGLYYERKIAGNVFLRINTGKNKAVKNGKSLVTNINALYQEISEELLMEQMKKYKSDHGSVVIMEVSTGKIVTLSSIKRKNDDNFVRNYNYALRDAVEPGSTFKLMSMVAALEEGEINIKDKVKINKGKYSFYGKAMKDELPINKDSITIKKAFEVSSNVGIANVMLGIFKKQQKKFSDRLYQFHINKKTGVDLNNEPTPSINKYGNKSWSKLSIPWMSIGYEVKLTPLQVLNFYNAIANNCRLMKPYLLDKVIDNKNIIFENKPKVIDKICSDEVAKISKNLLKGVVENGNVKKILQSNITTMAGKTGTAQIAFGKSGYKKDGKSEYMASFAGFFPADVPKYSAIIMISKPKIKYYAGIVAAPVFKKIAEKISKYENELRRNKVDKKEFSMIYTKNSTSKKINVVYKYLGYDLINENNFPKWVRINSHKTNFSVNDIYLENKIMPNLKGFSVIDAISILEKMKIKNIKIEGFGVVSKQNIKHGKIINNKDKIILTLK